MIILIKKADFNLAIKIIFLYKLFLGDSGVSLKLTPVNGLLFV